MQIYSLVTDDSIYASGKRPEWTKASKSKQSSPKFKGHCALTILYSIHEWDERWMIA